MALLDLKAVPVSAVDSAPVEFECSVEQVRFQNKETLWGVALVRVEKKYIAPLKDACPQAVIEFKDSYNGGMEFIISGNLPPLEQGQYLKCMAVFHKDTRYGWQANVKQAIVAVPKGGDSLLNYLTSGIIDHIGPAVGRAIYKMFGDETERVFELNPERLKQVKGIGENNYPKIIQSWNENVASRDFCQFCITDLNKTNKFALRVWAHFGSHPGTEQLIRDNPWRLSEVRGIGFIEADECAQKLGANPLSVDRIKAGVKYLLSMANQQGIRIQKAGIDIRGGDSFTPYGEIVKNASALLDVPPASVEATIAQMESGEQLVISKDVAGYSGELEIENVICRGETVKAVYLTRSHRSEDGIAQVLMSLLDESDGKKTPIQKKVAKWTDKHWQKFFESGDLTDEQQDAVKMVMTKQASVLTGGPGTGKTHSLKQVIKWCENNDFSISLAAPTGRAAKVASEATGQEGFTIHRLLGSDGKSFMVEAFEPYENYYNKPEAYGRVERSEAGLDADLIIVDEMSMTDTWLCYELIIRVRPESHIVFVGDEDQLPSVGSGFVLGDMLASKVVPHTRLTKIHRQAEGSMIIKNAHKVNHGHPDLIRCNMDNGGPKDFFIFETDRKDQIPGWIVDLVSKKIPETFGHKPSDIQILAPMRAGENGINSLNAKLQARLNPKSPSKQELVTKSQTYRVGDPVMCIVNKYKKDQYRPLRNIGIGGGADLNMNLYTPVDVFNGDMGTIVGKGKNEDNEEVWIVDIDGFQIEYTNTTMMKELVLAYACTIHKSQGGQFPVVIIPVTMEAYIMLSRQLLYTGITRAKEMVILVVQKGVKGGTALDLGIRTTKINERNTALAYRLRKLAMMPRKEKDAKTDD